MVSALDPLRELDLLRGSEERDPADVLQEELERVGRDLRALLDLRLRLGLLLVAVDDGDLRVVEGGVELVELCGLELELVERERDLLGIESACPIAALEEALGLLGREDVLDRGPSGRALRFALGQTNPFPRRRSHGSHSTGCRQSPGRHRAHERALRIVSR